MIKTHIPVPSRQRAFAASALLTVSLLFSAPSYAAGDILVQIERIPGDSTQQGFEGAISALSWQWSMDRPGTIESGAMTNRSNVNIQTLNFVHYLDRASPLLMQHCATGKRIANARLTLRSSYGTQKPQPFLQIDLTNVIVTQVTPSGAVGETRPTELVVLGFETVNVKYTTRNETGKPAGEVRFGWNLATNSLK